MKGKMATFLVAAPLAVLATMTQAHPQGDGMGMMMGQGGSGGMGMMDGSMMDMMMGQGSGMGMMGRSGMMSGSMMDQAMEKGMGRMMQLPDLSNEQRERLTSRHRELQRQLLGLQQKALEAQFALQDAAAGQTPDPKAVGRALQGVFDIRRQMVEATIAAHNDALKALSDEQRQALASQGRGMGMSMGMKGMKGGMMHQQQ